LPLKPETGKTSLTQSRFRDRCAIGTNSAVASNGEL